MFAVIGNRAWPSVACRKWIFDLPPRPGRRDAPNARQAYGIDLLDGIGVGFDVVLAASPGPLGRPRNTPGGCLALDSRALFARIS